MKKSSVGIVGLGIAGLSIAAHLSRKGYAVTGFDKYSPPHPIGSSHGENRIIRRVPGEGVTYVEMAARAYELWPQIEKLSGIELFTANGCIDISQGNATWAENTMSLSEKFGLPARALTPHQLEQLLPYYNVQPGSRGTLSAASGSLKAEESISAMKMIALGHGAALHTSTEVTNINMHSGTISTKEGSTEKFDHVVISAGAWVQRFVPLPVHIEKRVVAWYKSAVPVGGSPSFTQGHGDGGVYGMPGRDGSSIKFASANHLKQPISSDVIATVTQDDQDHVDELARQYLRNIDITDSRYLACKYTLTDDYGFLIDRHPASPNTLIFSACSGHGFKYGPVYGEMAEVLIEGREDSYPVSMKTLSFKANNVNFEP